MTERWIEDGPKDAPVWLVGEAPGEAEAEQGRPFRGASGIELDKMLAEAGVARSDCFATNVCHVRPPSYQKNGKRVHNDIDQFFLTKTAAKSASVSAVGGKYPTEPILAGLSHLRDILAARQPRLVVALGNTPLWALTSHSGITKWRGSVFDTTEDRDRGPAACGGKVICTFHPADVLRQWTHRPIVVQDFRRACREAAYPEVRKPTWHFTIPRCSREVYEWFGDFQHHDLTCDTEGWGRVDCIGFAASDTDAICIPFKHETGPELHYWTEEDELAVTAFVRSVLTERGATFHNAVWDCQVIARRWGFLPRLNGDTQAKQHVAFPGLIGGRIDPITGTVDKRGSSLSLSFIASMYCDYYRYWKDDGRHFDPAIGDEVTYWNYNCEDCVRTHECSGRLDTIIEQGRLQEPLAHVMCSYGPAFAMMFGGLNYDRDVAIALRKRVLAARDSAKRWLDHVTGTDFNPNSHPQCKALFYDDLRVPLILNKDTKSATLDDQALETIARRQPLLWPLVKQIQNYRTLDTVKADLDPNMCSEDGLLRFGINPAFVETFRFSTNETAWGEGGNVQNIKRPDDE